VKTCTNPKIHEVEPGLCFLKKKTVFLQPCIEAAFIVALRTLHYVRCKLALMGTLILTLGMQSQNDRWYRYVTCE